MAPPGEYVTEKHFCHSNANFQKRIGVMPLLTRPALGRRLNLVSEMVVLSVVRGMPKKIRELIAPRYRPERHYMRGAGPACAARAAGRL